MEHFSIRPLEGSDVNFAYELIMIEGWNYAKEDVERMFRYNPLGCFIAQVEGKLVGHVFSVNYGKLGWIGLLIVKAECRRKGVGTLLMERAMNHLLNCGVETIRLEARFAVAELYRKLGFIDEYDSLRFLGINRKFACVASSNVKLLKMEMLKETAKFDAEYFGENRIKVLMGFYYDHPKLCFVSNEGAKIVGYIMCRKTETGYKIGPLMCYSENHQVTREPLVKFM